MSDEELGLDIFVEQQEDRRYVTVQALDEKVAMKRLELEPQPIFMQPAIVCRGTSYYRTVDNKNVVKFSWRPANRPSEVEHFRHAHARGVKGIVQLVGYEEITSVAELRQELKFTRKRTFRDMVSATDSFSQSQSFTAGSRVGEPSLQESKRKSVDSGRRPYKKSRSNSQASNLSQEVQASQESQPEMQPATQASAVDEDDVFRNRILTWIAVSPAGRSLDRFRDIPEMLHGLCDAIKAHRSLFIDGRTLHRDISPNNIIITDPKCADGFHGMLIDIDLSTQIDGTGKN